MKEGDVVLTPVPHSDGSIKNRPAILLREFPPYNDFLVCGVSTQLHQEVQGLDEVISISDPDFGSSSLKSESLIRLGCHVAAHKNSRIDRFDIRRKTSEIARHSG
jgi:mRNA interferase MazF